MDREQGSSDMFDARQEIEDLKRKLAAQTATQAGAQATQAAALTGAQATQAAMNAGLWAAVASGFVSLIVGMFLGITLTKTK